MVAQNELNHWCFSSLDPKDLGEVQKTQQHYVPFPLQSSLRENPGCFEPGLGQSMVSFWFLILYFLGENSCSEVG